MGIVPGPVMTRVLLLDGPHTLLQARLPHGPTFSDWPTIFPNAGSAIALIDRVVHHADILAIEGESYRRRVAEQTLTKRRAAKG